MGSAAGDRRRIQECGRFETTRRTSPPKLAGRKHGVRVRAERRLPVYAATTHPFAKLALRVMTASSSSGYLHRPHQSVLVSNPEHSQPSIRRDADAAS